MEYDREVLHYQGDGLEEWQVEKNDADTRDARAGFPVQTSKGDPKPTEAANDLETAANDASGATRPAVAAAYLLDRLNFGPLSDWSAITRAYERLEQLQGRGRFDVWRYVTSIVRAWYGSSNAGFDFDLR